MFSWLLEIVLEVLLESLMSILAEVPLDLGIASFKQALTKQKNTHPILAGLGIAVLGCLVGLTFCLVFPRRIVPPWPLPGLSLALSPLLSGIAMNVYGHLREKHRRSTSYLATFWGGALFAFCLAGVRFVMIP